MEARIRSDTEEEMEVGEILDVHQGDTYCESCKIDVATTKRLKEHVIKFYEGKFRHLCKECNKGYMSKDGFISGFMKRATKVATQTVLKKIAKGGSHLKRLRRDTTKCFTLGKFKNTGVSFAHSTNLLGQCGI